MALYYDVTVDISANKVIDSGYHFTQGDSQQIFLKVAVMNGYERFDGSNAKSVTINFKKPDGTFVEGIPEYINGIYQYQFLGNELQSAGSVICDIKFAYDSGRISSGMFKFTVDADTSSGENVKSSGYIGTLEKIKQDAEELVAQLEVDYLGAKGVVDNARQFAEKSQSYAVGGTGTRPDEDTDNAMYYADKANTYKEEAYAYTQDFKYTHIKYSENADGSNMTDAPTDNTMYIGIYTGVSKTAPATATAYAWTRIKGNDGNAYFADFDVVDGELLMSYTTDTGNLSFQLNELTGELEVIK